MRFIQFNEKLVSRSRIGVTAKQFWNEIGFCKRAADVVVVQFLNTFFTARESNNRQTFKWMNSIKFRVSLLAKHWTYQNSIKTVNVVILPIETYKSSFNIQNADVVDVKLFVKVFAAREWADRQTVDESHSIKFKTTFVGEHTTYVFNYNGTSKYLRCDFGVWK